MAVVCLLAVYITWIFCSR